MSKRASTLSAFALAVALIGCAGQDARPADSAATTSEPTPTAPTESAEPTPTVATSATPAPPTPQPSPSAPALFRPGERVIVTRGGADYLEITVSKVATKSRYGSGYTVDKPKPGNVYLEAYVTYVALADGATYNPFDWQVFCNDTAIDNFTFLLSGPEPALGSGTLPKGRKAAGWLVYEVPAKGRCVLSYGANAFLGEGAVFEVLLRES
jgi:hypothetical protein